MMTAKIKITPKKTYNLLLSLAICSETLVLYAIAFINKLPVVSVFAPAIMPIVYTILALFALRPQLTKWIRLQDFIFILVCVGAFVYTYYMMPQNWQYIKNYLFVWILPCIPFFFLGLLFSADEETMDFVSAFSCISIVSAILYTIYFQRSGRILESDNMSASYAIMMNVLIALNYAFRKRKISSSLIAMIGVAYVFSLGTRGPLIIITAYTIIEMWRYSRHNTKVKIAITIIALLCIVAILESNIYIVILNQIGGVLTRIGLSNRITEYLKINSLISDSSGRDNIYSIIIERIKEKPITGYGIYGEWQFVNYSAHNIYLEALINFGVLLGGTLIIIYIFLFCKSLSKNNNRYSIEWLIMWGCAIFIRGIFGGTIFSSGVFFLLGFMIRTHREMKTKNKELMDIRCTS